MKTQKLMTTTTRTKMETNNAITKLTPNISSKKEQGENKRKKKLLKRHRIASK